ncbi:MAG: dihydrolipoyl dehydrogenase [Candidatus Nitrosopolaris sp.]
MSQQYSIKLQKFDLIVIGAGSGLEVANAAYQHGLRVAVAEKDRMGGTCLNNGCIPSKLLIHSADIAETIKRADLFGIKVDGYAIEFEKIVQRVNSITDSDSDGIRNAFEGIDNPKLFPKECKFVGPKTITIVGDDSQDIITAEKILIASGARPRIPNIKGLEGTGYLTSEEALRLKKQPHTLTIIGGGYIACELAHFFGALGTKINIIQRKNVLIPNEDEEVSQKFTEVFSKKYNVYVDYETEYVSRENEPNSGSKFHVIAKKDTSGNSIELVSDQLLIAAGRIPNSDTLDLAKTGVRVGEKGYIKTDKYLETDVNGIFALGDIIGRYLFKHNANHEARYVANNILHPDKKVPVNYAAMPHAIFSSPQVAGVGFTEHELKKEGLEYQKSVYSYINTAMGHALEDRDGFVKFLADKTNGKILGCHIIGSEASILIHEVLVAMRADDNGGNIENITKTVHIHPALSEVVARAAADIRRK